MEWLSRYRIDWQSPSHAGHLSPDQCLQKHCEEEPRTPIDRQNGDPKQTILASSRCLGHACTSVEAQTHCTRDKPSLVHPAWIHLNHKQNKMVVILFHQVLGWNKHIIEIICNLSLKYALIFKNLCK